MHEQFIHRLQNGFTLVAESVPAAKSAALCFLIPGGGGVMDPPKYTGAATVLAEWILRGAGERDSRALTNYLDMLGIQRAAAADTIFLRFSAAMLARQLPVVLPVYADMLRQPHLPEDGFAPSLDLALQQLSAVEDEPASKLAIELRRRHFDSPFGRPAIGISTELKRLTAKALRRHFASAIGPKGTILAVAGNFNWNHLRDVVEQFFAGWAVKNDLSMVVKPAARGNFHIRMNAGQVQIGLACDCLPENHPESPLMHAAAEVLSGGAGGRLFFELREKQGLCYGVNVDYHSFLDRAAMFGFSASAPERAEQTLLAFMHELRQLRNGVTGEELNRAKVGMKSRLILQAETTPARAAALAHDFYYHARLRNFDELRRRIDAITLERLNRFLAENPLENFTVVTVGGKKIFS